MENSVLPLPSDCLCTVFPLEWDFTTKMNGQSFSKHDFNQVFVAQILLFFLLAVPAEFLLL